MRSSFYRCIGKRLLDVSVSFILLIGCMPLLMLIALCVRLMIGPSIWFCQPRLGRNGRRFTLLKFRTMTQACDDQGHLLPDAERLVPFGRFLRRASLDELPELINILKGEMSLVGPRPLLAEYRTRYSAEQFRRHEVRPGLTGWAQVNGRNHLTWEQKFACDVWYVDHVSFWLDARILVNTVWCLLRPEGIHEPGQVTMRPFEGSQH